MSLPGPPRREPCDEWLHVLLARVQGWVVHDQARTKTFRRHPAPASSGFYGSPGSGYFLRPPSRLASQLPFEQRARLPTRRRCSPIAIFESLQHTAFDYFIGGQPANGLIRDRSRPTFFSIAAVGFGLTAIARRRAWLDHARKAATGLWPRSKHFGNRLKERMSAA